VSGALVDLVSVSDVDQNSDKGVASSVYRGQAVMGKVAEKLKGQLGRLSTRERAEIAQFLIHSLEEETDVDAEAAWDAELARRAEDIKAGKAVGEPAKKVLAELREKYS